MKTVVQGLWIGDTLGPIQRLSITSFLQQGHEYHLYCYDRVADVPPGVVIKDGNEILPATAIFRHQRGPEQGSVAPFSDLFRFKLLLERGGWWVDLDVICLKPFIFHEPIVLASEHTRHGTQLATAVLKLPAGHAVARRCFETANATDKSTLQWAEVGPILLSKIAAESELTECSKGPVVFCPIPWWGWRLFLSADPSLGISFITSESYSVHLWHEMWRRAGVERQETVCPSALFSQLWKAYGGSLLQSPEGDVC